MKKITLLLLVLFITTASAIAQVPYNPFTQNIHFAPEPTVFGFSCNTVQTAIFTQGLTTQADYTDWINNPLIDTIIISGFTFNGPASTAITGSYASNFNWVYLSPTVAVGTQNQSLPGTGTNPIFPNPLATGSINVSLFVPINSPVSTVLSVYVNLKVPATITTNNIATDDEESTQTQTFCDCYALTDPGVMGVSQTFCANGNPSVFTETAAPSGGSGSTIVYQWQELIGTIWTDIVGATSQTYDAPGTSITRQYRRNVKRDACGDWLNSNVLSITINSIPIADAGTDKNLNCLTPSATIGTLAAVGNVYSWSPTNGMILSNIAQPIITPNATTIYTVTVTSISGCIAIDEVLVSVDKTQPVADAGTAKSLCLGDSLTIGTPALPGISYSWTPALGLDSPNIAQPMAGPSLTTSYTVTVSGTNACTATDVVMIFVDTCVVDISGTVYNDTNALTNLNIDGIGIHNPDGVQLYAHLLDSNGNVLRIAPITANGTYEFQDVLSNHSYSIILSTVQGNIGTPAPIILLPGTWVNIGEDCCDQMGHDGNPDGSISFSVTTHNKEHLNFGIKNPNPTTSLPVDLESFYVIDYNCEALLSWITSLEINASHVQVFRRDNGQGGYKKIATVQSAGNSNEKKMYSYLDKEVSKDADYEYQLKFVDVDGKFTLSDIKNLKLDCDDDDAGIKIFPNPAFNEINLLCLNDLNEIDFSLDINDISGRKVVSKTQLIYKGGTVITIDISALAVGTYLLNYRDSEGVFIGSEKFIKR